jgi:hypothetical protein
MVSRVRLWGQIDAYPICFPLHTNRLSAVVTRFAVPVSAARPLVPGRFFEFVEVHGNAQLVVTGLEFDWGTWRDGRQVSLGFVVRPAWDPAAPPGTYLWRSLVNRRFDREAGHRVFGIASAVADVTVSCVIGAVNVGVEEHGEPALHLRLPRTAPRVAGAPIASQLYTCIDDVPHRTPFEIGAPRRVVSDTSAVEVSVGSGPLADVLRSLGLPRAPDRCVWDDRLAATFEAAIPA